MKFEEADHNILHNSLKTGKNLSTIELIIQFFLIDICNK